MAIDLAMNEDPAMEGDMEPEYATVEEKRLHEEEVKAQAQNNKAEERRKKLLLKKRKGVKETKAEREAKANQLEDLLKRSAAFSDILTKKTQVLGRVGSGFDGKVLGEHNLEMAKQPNCMIGGKMRDYQLEGLTWMYEICSQGMSGILADEMGLGKTIQTISLIALLREKENYLGPHLIIAPLSTLSNWIEEFQKWTPTVPVLLYHGDPIQRKQLRDTTLMKNIKNGRPTDKFPIVCTSPEIVLRDNVDLSKINWEFIIIDEGHRMKNSDSKLFITLRTFKSATRLLITGTPLQNNLKELWSLLNFLLPQIFTNWEAFESWFDFSDLQDEEGTEEFLADQKKQELVKKIHLILQPLLLRRVKADVEHLLPKKREYILYAPLTKDQNELYNAISNKDVDTRKYLEDKVVERLMSASPAEEDINSEKPKNTKKVGKNTPLASSSKQGGNQKANKASKSKANLRSKSSTIGGKENSKAGENESDDDTPLAIRSRPKNGKPANAFEAMMRKATSSVSTIQKETNSKRKLGDDLSSPATKSLKSSRESTPGSIRSRKSRPKRSYAETDASDEDKLSDDDFEEKLRNETLKIEQDEESEDEGSEEKRLARILEHAKKEISTKKLGNPIMQLRLTCNSTHHFYNPFAGEHGLPVDETLVASSGKMLLLDRLLPALFDRGHKVLIFSQFKTQLDILQDYAQELRKWPICRIDGSVAQDDRRQQIKDFNERPDYKLFLLSTRSGGQGINLASADTVILFDSDWNPQQDLQAQDRVHRIGQKKPVIIFRLATKGTVEEELLLSADAKRRLEKLVIKKGGFKTMGQKMEQHEEMSPEALKALLLKDGHVWQYRGPDHMLSDADLDVLLDRTDDAYLRAEKGLGNADAFKIVTSSINGLMMG